MEVKFWHQKWEQNNIGFHLNKANPMLIKYFNQLSLSQGARVFLPLCGMTLDIDWLLTNGFQVVGVELSDIAVSQLFSRLAIVPQVKELGSGLQHLSGVNIDLFVGDIFALSPTIIGPVNAVYDRAALVALPKNMRHQYSEHLIKITNLAPQLLITYEYDQSLMDGPPFSVTEMEIRKLYQDSYDLIHLICVDVPNGMQGKCPAKEHVWQLNIK